MPIQLLINIFIAFLWMLLKDEFNSLTFLTGYLVGLCIVFGMRRFFPTPFYLKKFWAAIKLVYILIRELILSSIYVMKYVVNPKLVFRPGIFALETKLRGDWEITLISLMISLTPGSVVMEVSHDGKTLYIHAMDTPDVQDTVINSINVFEKAIMEVTRNS